MPGVPATLKEFEQGKLHSGSKTGPIVKSRAQAIAIGMNDKGGTRPAGFPKKKKRGIGGAIAAQLAGSNPQERMSR